MNTDEFENTVFNIAVFGTPFRPDGAVVGGALACFLLVMVFVGLTNCSCESIPTTDNLGPSTEMYTLVQRSTHAWLAPRVSMEDRGAHAFLQGDWRVHDNTVDLALWFQSVGDQPLWDIRRLIASLKTSELYQSDPPSDSELTRMLKLAMDTFQHE